MVKPKLDQKLEPKLEPKLELKLESDAEDQALGVGTATPVSPASMTRNFDAVFYVEKVALSTRSSKMPQWMSMIALLADAPCNLVKL
jgi:hypothetical protein